MITTDTRDWRPLIFLAVLIVHISLVQLVIRVARSPMSSAPSLNEPLLLFLVPHKTRAPDAVIYPHRADKQPSATSGARAADSSAAANPPAAADPSAAADNSTQASSQEPPPIIDWEKEAQLATQNAISNADKKNSYRNLAALSPEQLSWVRQNHLEPAVPGIPWKYRRVEIAEDGFPIIHINDHCVAIPLLMMMVFCKIGHIEAKGDMFEHMRDPHDP